MKVSELIDALLAMPQDLSVGILYDGAARNEVVHAWVARGGHSGPFVVLGGDQEPVYYDSDRPVYAPTEKENAHWQTGDDGSGLPALIHLASCDLIAAMKRPITEDDEEDYANSAHCHEVEERSYIVRRLAEAQRAASVHH